MPPLLNFSFPAASMTAGYVVVRRQADQQVRNQQEPAWEEYDEEKRAEYAIALTNAGGDLWAAELDEDFPEEGSYRLHVYRQAGESPTETDLLVGTLGLEEFTTPSVVISPLMSVITAQVKPMKGIEVFQHTRAVVPITVIDSQNSPVDLSDRTLRFVVYRRDRPTQTVFQVDQADIAIAGDDDNVAQITIEPEDLATIATHKCQLWDLDANVVLAFGPFIIEPSNRGTDAD